MNNTSGRMLKEAVVAYFHRQMKRTVNYNYSLDNILLSIVFVLHVSA